MSKKSVSFSFTEEDRRLLERVRVKVGVLSATEALRVVMRFYINGPSEVFPTLPKPTRRGRKK